MRFVSIVSRGLRIRDGDDKTSLEDGGVHVESVERVFVFRGGRSDASLSISVCASNSLAAPSAAKPTIFKSISFADFSNCICCAWISSPESFPHVVLRDMTWVGGSGAFNVICQTRRRLSRV